MKVIVASKNPVKLEVAKAGFSSMFPGETIECIGISVSSGVSDQPDSYEETLTGAKNRVKNAHDAYADADFWVGMEGGTAANELGVETAAFIYVMDKHGNTNYSRTASVQLSPKVVELLEQGIELSKADDMVFGTKDSGTNAGVTGILTNGLLPRTIYYLQAMQLALVPWKNTEAYFV